MRPQYLFGQRVVVILRRVMAMSKFNTPALTQWLEHLFIDYIYLWASLVPESGRRQTVCFATIKNKQPSIIRQAIICGLI